MNSTFLKSISSSSSNSFELKDIWSDDLLAIWVPIAVYWGQCTLFEILMRLKIPFFEQYRIHTPDDRDKRNKVSFGKVLVMVALQHVVQIFLGIALLKSLDPEAEQLKYQRSIANYSSLLFSLLIKAGQPKEKAMLLASNLAVFIQDYIVSAVKFFIAM